MPTFARTRRARNSVTLAAMTAILWLGSCASTGDARVQPVTLQSRLTDDVVRSIDESGGTCCAIGVLLPNSLEHVALTAVQRETATRLCGSLRHPRLIAEHLSADVAVEMKTIAAGPACPAELGDTTCGREDMARIVTERRAQGFIVAVFARPEDQVRVLSLPVDRALTMCPSAPTLVWLVDQIERDDGYRSAQRAYWLPSPREQPSPVQ